VLLHGQGGFAVHWAQVIPHLVALVNSGALGRLLSTPGALVALARYSVRRSEANFDRLIRTQCTLCLGLPNDAMTVGRSSNRGCRFEPRLPGTA
jgi:hypothetical protein